MIPVKPSLLFLFLIISIVTLFVGGCGSGGSGSNDAESVPPVEGVDPPDVNTPEALTYPIVDTGISDYYSDTAIIPEPIEGAAFYGQDAHYVGPVPSYTNNGDGTVTDNVTELMWQQDMGIKISHEAASAAADALNLGGHSDCVLLRLKSFTA